MTDFERWRDRRTPGHPAERELEELAFAPDGGSQLQDLRRHLEGCPQCADQVKALELDTLPAFVHIRTDLSVASKAEGWDPLEWRAAATDLGRGVCWPPPHKPAPRVPRPGAVLCSAPV